MESSIRDTTFLMKQFVRFAFSLAAITTTLLHVPEKQLHAQSVQMAQQQPNVGGQFRRVVGTIVKPSSEGVEPTGIRGVTVTLHRVARDSAGPLDSVTTDATGGYSFSFRTFGLDAVYFASVTYGGIAYFTAPFRDSVATGDAAVITVFDTTSTQFPLSVRGRHLIVGAIDSTNHRTVIEVFELSNDSLSTLISADTMEQSATWSTTIPETAKDFRINETELSADALIFRTGRVLAFSPFSPGLSQVSFSYRVPAADYPMSITTTHAVDVLEILLEEPKGNVVADGITLVGNVNLEGRTFRRFLAQDTPPSLRIVLDVPSARPFAGNLYMAALLIVIGAAMLLVLMRAMGRRRGTTVASQMAAAAAKTGASNLPLHERLASEIAQLDDIYQRNADPSDEVRLAYERRRNELRSALANALAQSVEKR